MKKQTIEKNYIVTVSCPACGHTSKYPYAFHTEADYYYCRECETKFDEEPIYSFYEQK